MLNAPVPLSPTHQVVAVQLAAIQVVRAGGAGGVAEVHLVCIHTRRVGRIRPALVYPARALLADVEGTVAVYRHVTVVVPDLQHAVRVLCWPECQGADAIGRRDIQCASIPHADEACAAVAIRRAAEVRIAVDGERAGASRVVDPVDHDDGIRLVAHLQTAYVPIAVIVNHRRRGCIHRGSIPPCGDTGGTPVGVERPLRVIGPSVDPCLGLGQTRAGEQARHGCGNHRL